MHPLDHVDNTSRGKTIKPTGPRAKTRKTRHTKQENKLLDKRATKQHTLDQYSDT